VGQGSDVVKTNSAAECFDVEEKCGQLSWDEGDMRWGRLRRWRRWGRRGRRERRRRRRRRRR
jgi:hypothetical protein